MATDARQWREFEALHRQMWNRYHSVSLYDALGVKPDATDEQIKDQYWKKARLYHSDSHNPKKPADAEQRMKDINGVNEILSNPEKRASYDEWLRIAGGGVSGAAADAGRAGSSANARPGAEARSQQSHYQDPTPASSSQGRGAYVPKEKVHVPQSGGDHARAFNFGFGRVAVNSGSYYGGGLERKVDRMYEHVQRVNVNNSIGNITLGLSNDGKVHLRGLTSSEPEYSGGNLSINDLKGELLLPPDDKTLEVVINTATGDVKGKVAHKGRITSATGDIRLELHAPLEVRASVVIGRVNVKKMISEGRGRYTPPDTQLRGTLEVSCATGGVNVDYVAGK